MQKRISFLQIDEIVERVMESHKTIHAPNLEAIMETDSYTRKIVYDMVD